MQYNASKMSAFAEGEDDVEENPSVLRGYTDEFNKADKHQVVKKRKIARITLLTISVKRSLDT